MSLACARTACKYFGTLFIITFSVKQVLTILLWLVGCSQSSSCAPSEEIIAPDAPDLGSDPAWLRLLQVLPYFSPILPVSSQQKLGGKAPKWF